MASRSYTPEEVREKVLDHMKFLCQYWSQLDRREHHDSEKDRMMGLCFSILNIFDGTTMEFPAMDIVLSPHPSDKNFHIERDQNWFEKGMVINDCTLHDEWYKNRKTT